MRRLVPAMMGLFLAVFAAEPARALPETGALALPFVSLTSGDFPDLEPLRARLAGARVVQLGESGHGAAEYSMAKTRLVRFLHEEMGFDVLALESDPYLCAMADRAAASATPEATLTSCAFGVWHTREVLELFAYVRSTRETGRPLLIAGYDVQPIGPGKAGRPGYLAEVVGAIDPEAAEMARALDAEFLEIYGLGGSVRRTRLRENRAELLARYDDLYRFLVRNEAELLERHAGADDASAPLLAQQIAWSAMQYIRLQTAPDAVAYGEERDWGMARNLIFTAERMHPGRKVIVWAHNAHVAYGNHRVDLTGIDEPAAVGRGAGTWLQRHFGPDLFTVGLYAASGSMTRNDREIVTVSPVRPGSLEAQSIPAGAAGMLYVAPSVVGQDPFWDRPTTAKYWGAADVPMTLRDQYDAVLLLGSVSPPAYLSPG
ncbi:erythromycin esterase family protein [Roseibacterium beibuensis]|uniref:erythromycin esterase family protein n=1 Tax=[Roseibacterium] beibuensis TaxID=1193142 RepID=UPI00217F1599|nr:erythromycin esterase family protein [Roseibacterium beibuensis]MCS6626370.1 erythromycin esterase family protein [Roseibacterium beibuensis]